MSWIRSQVRPAAMVTKMKRSSRLRRMGSRGSSTSCIIWGFTPKKMSLAVRAISSLVDKVPPGSSAARAAALAGVRLASRMVSASPLLAAALAMAEPIFPVPIKPMV